MTRHSPAKNAGRAETSPTVIADSCFLKATIGRIVEVAKSRYDLEVDLHVQLDRLLHRSAALSARIQPPSSTADAPARALLRAIRDLGPVRSSELSDRTGLSRPSVSRYLAELASDGLVAVQRDPGDGRAALLTLTDAGAERLDRIVDRGRRAVHEVTQDFTQEEMDAFARLLARWNDNTEELLPARRRRYEEATT